MVHASFLNGKNIFLKRFLAKDITPRYIKWLNDREVNKYSRRRFQSTNKAQARKYLASLGPNEAILAIYTKENKHIGNIKYGPTNQVNKSAEISILMGEKSEWGKGYASEAIYLVTKYLFNVLNLHRAEAGSVNPAFIHAVTKKLGWKKEGVLREAFLLDRKFIDVTKLSLLSKEFKIIPKFE